MVLFMLKELEIYLTFEYSFFLKILMIDKCNVWRPNPANAGSNPKCSSDRVWIPNFTNKIIGGAACCF
jgi:hypothetical protein